MSAPQVVLSFWFEEHGPRDWFAANEQFDQLISAQFGDTHQLAVKGGLESWRVTPQGALAEIIVLDQFSRQIYRGRAEAFACDEQALHLSQRLVSSGNDRKLSMQERQFAYMPFMHAENTDAQRKSLQLFAELGEPALRSATEHHAIIAAFGRYPHRNRVLGRVCTAAELAYLEADSPSFGQ